MLPSGLLVQSGGLRMDSMWNPHMIKLPLPLRDVLTPMERSILGQGTGHNTLHRLSYGSTFVECVYLESLERGSLSQIWHIIPYSLILTLSILKSVPVRILLT